jgi:dTDP-4-amino-4,6-dideoxygalactose transaminase
MVEKRLTKTRRILVGDLRLEAEEKQALSDVLLSGRISEGRKVAEFEKEWAAYIGTKYSVLVNSGTSALIAGFEALKHAGNIKEKSKVLTTPITYIATTNALALTGLEPIYVDVDPDRFIITPDRIKEALESVKDPGSYSAILPVHLTGYACDMDGINRIAKEYALTVVEDSSQAHGTKYKGRRTGCMSTLSTYSFYIAHNIQVGEMGAVNTDDISLLRFIKRIKANGRMCDCQMCTRTTTGCPKIKSYKGADDFDPRFTHDIIGYNFKTMEFQAALARTQLARVDSIIKKRQENVRYLNDALQKYSDVLQLPSYSDDVSYMVYPIVVKEKSQVSRKQLRESLEKRGIETRPLFGCIPTQQPAYAHLKKEYAGKLPNAEYLGSNAFYIGCHQYLKEDDLRYVADCFRDAITEHGRI